MKQTLKDLRKSLKLTQEEFGERFGVSGPLIVNAEKHGRISDGLKEKIEKEFKIQLEFNNNNNEETPAWFERLETMWRNEVDFLKDQIAKKDKMLDALTEKLVKVEVSNWPPLVPISGADGVGNRELLRVA